MLTDQQVECIELLAQGELKKQEIADRIKVTRRTIYNWMDNDEFKKILEEFKKELHNRTRIFQNLMQEEGHAKLVAKGQIALDNIFKLANSAKQEKIRLDANVFIWESIYGKATSRIQDITDEEKENNNKVSEEDLKAEFTKFKKVKDDNEDKPNLKVV